MPMGEVGVSLCWPAACLDLVMATCVCSVQVCVNIIPIPQVLTGVIAGGSSSPEPSRFVTLMLERLARIESRASDSAMDVTRGEI